MTVFSWRSAARLSFLLVMVAVVVLPLSATVLGGFKTNPELRAVPFGLPTVWRTEFYANVILDPRVWTYLWNSLIVAVLTVALTLLLGAMAAYAFAQVRFFGSKFLFSYLLLGLMFPLAAALIPLFLTIRDLGLLDSAMGIVLPQTAFGLAFSIMFFRAFFEELPAEMFEAARVDGCGYIRFFFTFTLPLSAPILATVAVFTFVTSWNNYLLPLIMLNDPASYTWTLGVMDYKGEYIFEWNQVLAFVTVTTLPAVVFFVAAQKYIVAGLTGGAVKG